MMRICALGLLAFLSLNHAMVSEPASPPKSPQIVRHLTVISSEKSYGLLFVAAKDTRCPFLRYRILVAGKMLLTHALRPGEAMIADMGMGLVPGTHKVAVQSVGCVSEISVMRSMVLRKTSPDHGARALAALAREDQKTMIFGFTGMEPT